MGQTRNLDVCIVTMILLIGAAGAGDPRGSGPGAGGSAGEGFDFDGRSDLVIAVHGETVSLEAFAGTVAVIYGSRTGLTGSGNQLWHQDGPGIVDQCDPDQHFGAALAARTPDWVFADDFESGGLSRWSSSAR